MRSCTVESAVKLVSVVLWKSALAVPSEMWCEGFWRVLIACCCAPEECGFVAKDLRALLVELARFQTRR